MKWITKKEIKNDAKIPWFELSNIEQTSGSYSEEAGGLADNLMGASPAVDWKTPPNQFNDQFSDHFNNRFDNQMDVNFHEPFSDNPPHDAAPHEDHHDHEAQEVPYQSRLSQALEYLQPPAPGIDKRQAEPPTNSEASITDFGIRSEMLQAKAPPAQPENPTENQAPPHAAEPSSPKEEEVEAAILGAHAAAKRAVQNLKIYPPHQDSNGENPNGAAAQQAAQSNSPAGPQYNPENPQGHQEPELNRSLLSRSLQSFELRSQKSGATSPLSQPENMAAANEGSKWGTQEAPAKVAAAPIGDSIGDSIGNTIGNTTGNTESMKEVEERGATREERDPRDEFIAYNQPAPSTSSAPYIQADIPYQPNFAPSTKPRHIRFSYSLVDKEGGDHPLIFSYNLKRSTQSLQPAQTFGGPEGGPKHGSEIDPPDDMEAPYSEEPRFIGYDDYPLVVTEEGDEDEHVEEHVEKNEFGTPDEIFHTDTPEEIDKIAETFFDIDTEINREERRLEPVFSYDVDDDIPEPDHIHDDMHPEAHNQAPYHLHEREDTPEHQLEEEYEAEIDEEADFYEADNFEEAPQQQQAGDYSESSTDHEHLIEYGPAQPAAFEEQPSDDEDEEAIEPPPNGGLLHQEEESELEEDLEELENIAETPQEESSLPRQNYHEEGMRASITPLLALNSQYNIPFNLLNTAPDEDTQEGHEEQSRVIAILEETLDQFGIEARVVGIQKGPIITRYEVKIPPGIKVNRILNLTDELAMALEALRVRIEAPIPGRSSVGIEIPNRKRAKVLLGDILNHPDFHASQKSLPLPLGKDIAGNLLVEDLTKMPHILIAGATGSGKSVAVNSFITSLILTRTPQEVRMLMVDPKLVELSHYNDIPHLLHPVIVDPQKAVLALNWAVEEMERRYEDMADLRARDIISYNSKVKDLKADPGKHYMPEHMPYIVVLIDELGDLMMVAGKEVESSIIRLSQKARAVGIHLILATQRPSVDVITALIKANCPARIALQVAQKTDSRTILDSNGGEQLLGQGDLLFKHPSKAQLIRAQAPLVEDYEVEEVVRNAKRLASPSYITLEDPRANGGELDSEDEDLFEEAWEIIIESGKASASYLQRRLRIGYNRAARVIEALEARGYIGPQIGSKPREIIGAS